jgi:hypothetical protein
MRAIYRIWEYPVQSQAPFLHISDAVQIFAYNMTLHFPDRFYDLTTSKAEHTSEHGFVRNKACHRREYYDPYA